MFYLAAEFPAGGRLCPSARTCRTRCLRNRWRAASCRHGTAAGSPGGTAGWRRCGNQRHARRRGHCCSAARRWMASGISGGTSFRAPANASSRPRRHGNRAPSHPFQATRSSSRCRTGNRLDRRRLDRSCPDHRYWRWQASQETPIFSAPAASAEQSPTGAAAAAASASRSRWAYSRNGASGVVSG